MGYRMDGPDSIPCTIKVSLLHSVQIVSKAQWIPKAISPGIKRPESEADHLFPSSAYVKNGGAISPLPNMFLLHSA
jgi:hypothetical protein